MEKKQGPTGAAAADDGPGETKGVRGTFAAKLKPMDTDGHYDDDPLTESEINLLEGAASTGNIDTLHQTAKDLVDQTGQYGKKHLVQKAANELENQLIEANKKAAEAQAVVTGKPSLTGVPFGIGEDQVKQLETVAKTGDKGFLTATANVMAAGPSYKTPAAKKALFDVVGALQGQLDAIAIAEGPTMDDLDDLDDQAPGPAPTRRRNRPIR